MAEKSTDSKKSFRPPFVTEQMWQELGLTDWSERIKAMNEVQVRSMRHLTEQYVAYGQHLSEQISAQAKATAQLAKEGLDHSINLMDAWNRIALDTTKNVIDHLEPKN